jgi:hypothetical protein
MMMMMMMERSSAATLSPQAHAHCFIVIKKRSLWITLNLNSEFFCRRMRPASGKCDLNHSHSGCGYFQEPTKFRYWNSASFILMNISQCYLLDLSSFLSSLSLSVLFFFPCFTFYAFFFFFPFYFVPSFPSSFVLF